MKAKLQRRTLRPDVPVRQLTAGDLFIEFWQTLPSPDDPSRKVAIEPFQIAFAKALLDPQRYDEEFAQNVREVKQAILTIARKNGKTTFASALVLGFLVGPLAKYNQQLYSVAFEREQAALTYNTAVSVIQADEELSGLIRCVETHKLLTCPLNRSRFRSLSAEYRSKHGLNPALVIFDELAQFGSDRGLFDTMMTSMGAQAEPLMLTISTQAASNEAVLSQLVDYGREVNAGRLDDKSFVLMEYTTPSDEELAQVGKTIWDEDTWYLANPALGKFRSLQEMREMARKAKQIPSLELTFRNLYLNQRVAAYSLFVSPSTWDACAGWPTSDEEMIGRPAFIGIDLSSRVDLTAVACAIQLDDGRIALETHAFTPQDTLEERSKRDRADYIGWAKRGFLQAIPGVTISFSVVARCVIELCEKYDVRLVVFDRWRFEQFKKELLELDESFDEALLAPFGQGFKDMSPAIDRFEEKLLNKVVLHGNHPVLRWAFSNAVVEKDAAGNRKLTKAKSYGRIDPGIAAVMSIGGAHAVLDNEAAPIGVV